MILWLEQAKALFPKTVKMTNGAWPVGPVGYDRKDLYRRPHTTTMY